MQTKITALLTEAAKFLADYLSRALPAISENWWKDTVLEVLKFQQRRRIEQRGINTISALDLAALLRILDQNWYQISNKMNLPLEARHFVKEMQTVRNRWAHAGAEGFPDEDIYRDLDTLQRLAIAIEAKGDFVQRVKHIKAYYASQLQIQAEHPLEREVTPPLEPRPGRRRIVRPPIELEAPKTVSTGTLIKTRKPRDPQSEIRLKMAVGALLRAELHENFRMAGRSQLAFLRSGRRYLCKFSSFDHKHSRWFWGVSRTYWAAWTLKDYLILILENWESKGYSYILFDAQMSKQLLERCGQDKREEKKINMIISATEGRIRLQEWSDLLMQNRIKPLPGFEKG